MFLKGDTGRRSAKEWAALRREMPAKACGGTCAGSQAPAAWQRSSRAPCRSGGMAGHTGAQAGWRPRFALRVERCAHRLTRVGHQCDCLSVQGEPPCSNRRRAAPMHREIHYPSQNSFKILPLRNHSNVRKPVHGKGEAVPLPRGWCSAGFWKGVKPLARSYTEVV